MILRERSGEASGSCLAMPLRAARQLRGILLIAALLALWEASARLGWVNSSNWPPVSGVVLALIKGWTNGELLALTASTLRRMALGYAIGCAAGIVLGSLLAVDRWARYALNPLVEILRPIPAPAIVPMLILFLGVDDLLKVVVVALACFFPVFLNTLSGIAGMDSVLIETARTFRISRLRTLTRVILPAATPMIAAGMRIAIGIALVVTVISEMIAGSAGLGYYIVQMQYAMRPEPMYAAIVSLSATGYLLNRAFVTLERRWIPWVGR
jgi:ABC-type nitrate/sulfonate/bicarbonate transport system permease component